MNDLISRQAAIEAVHSTIFDFFDICEDDSDSPITESDKRLLELNKAITTAIRRQPTIDPVKHGKWEVLDAEEPRWYGCSECKKMARWPYNYCPNCGAQMDWGEE